MSIEAVSLVKSASRRIVIGILSVLICRNSAELSKVVLAGATAILSSIRSFSAKSLTSASTSATFTGLSPSVNAPEKSRSVSR